MSILFFDQRRTVYYTLPSKKRITFHSYKEKIWFECKLRILDYSNNKRLKRLCYIQLKEWWDHLDEIVLAKPDRMKEVITKNENKKTGAVKLQKSLKNIFVEYYELVSKEYGLGLVEKLNVKTCPYCNRLFIYTFKGNDRDERPELDHFYPKDEYPIFCLSFYNLIPACHPCNHIKASKKIGINPYKGAFNSRFVITNTDGEVLLKPKIFELKKEEKKVAFSGPDKDEKKNIEILGLENVYNKHIDYVDELINKALDYDKYAREALVECFKGAAGYYPQKVYDFVWGKHLAEAQYEDRPLSKLTKDILDLLEIK